MEEQFSNVPSQNKQNQDESLKKKLNDGGRPEGAHVTPERNSSSRHTNRRESLSKQDAFRVDQFIETIEKDPILGPIVNGQQNHEQSPNRRESFLKQDPFRLQQIMDCLEEDLPITQEEEVPTNQNHHEQSPNRRESLSRQDASRLQQIIDQMEKDPIFGQFANSQNHQDEEQSPNRRDSLSRQDSFRLKEKIERMIKGASQLGLHEKKNYDTKVLTDPNARPSSKIEKAMHAPLGVGRTTPKMKGDNQVWVEKVLQNRETGETKVFFVSKQTGEKYEDEPPSGASRVLYLRDSVRIKTESHAKDKYEESLLYKSGEYDAVFGSAME